MQADCILLFHWLLSRRIRRLRKTFQRVNASYPVSVSICYFNYLYVSLRYVCSALFCFLIYWIIYSHIIILWCIIQGSERNMTLYIAHNILYIISLHNTHSPQTKNILLWNPIGTQFIDSHWPFNILTFQNLILVFRFTTKTLRVKTLVVIVEHPVIVSWNVQVLMKYYMSNTTHLL